MKNLARIKYVLLTVIFPFVLTSCLKEAPLKIPFQSYVPISLDDGWEIAEPEQVGIDGKALEEVYRYVHEEDNVWQIRSLLIFKDNKLVAESYMKDVKDRTNLHPIWSCTKQVVSILTGMTIDRGLISLDNTISDYLPQVSGHPEKSGITIKNLLLMKSGINYDNGGYYGGDAMLTRENPDNSLDFILGLNMHATPGAAYWYKDSDPHILSAIIQERVGKTTRDWAKEVLFDKIGIRNIEWRTYKDGITLGSFGILTTPREMGKIGQLVANNGLWNGEQIVSKEWLDEMTTARVSAEETEHDNMSFCYLWWKDATRNIAISFGHGGQGIIINKDKNLVIVITSERHTSGRHNLSFASACNIYDRINSIVH